MLRRLRPLLQYDWNNPSPFERSFRFREPDPPRPDLSAEGRRPPPWRISDEGRDPNKKYSSREQRERYGMAPDARSVVISAQGNRHDEYRPVKFLPEDHGLGDMYAFGKKGFKMPGLALFKDQPVPTVQDTEHYPMIWHFYSGTFSNKPLSYYLAKAKEGTLEPHEQQKLESMMTIRKMTLGNINKSHPLIKPKWKRTTKGGKK
eukprot:TRINITY_DN70997_c0_g1_i1.p1 TRINITY_DN70997_c0_g1~~TRINITY_DN70997_c0_g1_i1.p1  ORF type:complete len:233 (+),score=72.58 TRINITY_DN70997_c0_g1_i1:88-699(+)